MAWKVRIRLLSDQPVHSQTDGSVPEIGPQGCPVRLRLVFAGPQRSTLTFSLKAPTTCSDTTGVGTTAAAVAVVMWELVHQTVVQDYDKTSNRLAPRKANSKR